MSDRLVAKRLARRHRNANDRRSVTVAATTAGRALVDEVSARRRQEIARIVAGMAPDTQRLLVEALRAFADAAGEVSEQSWSGWEAGPAGSVGPERQPVPLTGSSPGP